MKNSSITLICAVLIGLCAVSGPVMAQQKTVKECRSEWQANKANNQAKGVTERPISLPVVAERQLLSRRRR